MATVQTTTTQAYYGYRYIKSPVDVQFAYRYFSDALSPSPRSSADGNDALRASHRGVQPIVGYGGHCMGGPYAKVGRSIAHKAGIACFDQDDSYRIRKAATHQIERPSESLSCRLRSDNDGYLKRVFECKRSFQ